MCTFDEEIAKKTREYDELRSTVQDARDAAKAQLIQQLERAQRAEECASSLRSQLKSEQEMVQRLGAELVRERGENSSMQKAMCHANENVLALQAEVQSVRNENLQLHSQLQSRQGAGAAAVPAAAGCLAPGGTLPSGNSSTSRSSSSVCAVQ